jgi:putative transposase
MLVFEAKLEGTKQQYERLTQAIRTARFVRNSCIRYWMDNKGIGKYELSAYCAVLAKEFPWAGKLNSQARQASAERAWSAITRFYDNVQSKPAKKVSQERKVSHVLRSLKLTHLIFRIPAPSGWGGCQITSS